MKYRRVVRRVTKHKAFLEVLIGLLLAYIIYTQTNMAAILEGLGAFSLVGALVAGFFFSSALTTVPALTALFILASSHPPFLIALFGAAGAALADLIMYRLFIHTVISEVEHDFKAVARLEKYRNRGVYKYLVPMLGAAIIASPLPDELGIALIGQKRLAQWKFLTYSFLANFMGILIVALLA